MFFQLLLPSLKSAISYNNISKINFCHKGQSLCLIVINVGAAATVSRAPVGAAATVSRAPEHLVQLDLRMTFCDKGSIPT